MIGVYYPKGAETGGPEALHQLVDSLRRQGLWANLIPIPGTENRAPAEAYKAYDAPEAVGGRFTTIVVPEIYEEGLHQHPYAKKYVWWLAAGTVKDKNPNHNHLAQSYHAHVSLQAQGIQSRIVSDYTTYVDDVPARVNQSGRVAFNGSKGADEAREVAKLLPDVEFVQIKNMSRAQVRETLRDATVYLDLGHHPGKDRMPREAAISGAVVITNRQGSAQYYDDVPMFHKVGGEVNRLGETAAFVKDVLEYPDAPYDSQFYYREKIKGEPEVFDNEVWKVFG